VRGRAPRVYHPFSRRREGGGGLILLSFFRQAGFYPASIHPSFSSPRQGGSATLSFP